MLALGPVSHDWGSSLVHGGLDDLSDRRLLLFYPFICHDRDGAKLNPVRAWIGLSDDYELGRRVVGPAGAGEIEEGAIRLGVKVLLAFHRYLDDPKAIRLSGGEPWTKKQDRNIERRHGMICGEYTVLEVRRGRNGSPGAGEADWSTPRRRHSVRSHLRRIRDDAGHVVRLLRIPKHWRGNLNRGVIVKDYELCKS